MDIVTSAELRARAAVRVGETTPKNAEGLVGDSDPPTTLVALQWPLVQPLTVVRATIPTQTALVVIKAESSFRGL